MNCMEYKQVNRIGRMTTQENKLMFAPAVVRGDLPGSVAGPLQRVPSAALLGARGELIIEHAGRDYRLRRTSAWKLILTA